MIIASWNAIPYIKRRRSKDPPQQEQHFKMLFPVLLSMVTCYIILSSTFLYQI